MKKSKVFALGIIATLSQFPLYAAASDFSLPFVNASGLGSAYSGAAAEANDASTAFTNPAGLIRITHQQLVFAAVGVTGTTQFTGSTSSTYPTTVNQSGTASSKLGGFLPSFYYALPLSDKVVVAFSETVPFGLGSNYAKDSIVRYADTKTQISVIDMGPSVGFKITDKLSGGFGLDADYLKLDLNYMVNMGSSPDAESQNSLHDWGYGYHAGLLYQFTPATRVGLSYISQVAFHPHGDSTLYSSGSEFTSSANTNIKLPALTQLGVYHDFNSQWAVMGNVTYTEWNTLQQVTLQDVAIPGGATTNATLPYNYSNTFDYAVGVKFTVNPQWTLRTGAAYFNSPSNSQDRIVADPAGRMTLVGIGAHYQQNCYLGYDMGYAHDFFQQVNYNHSTAFTSETGHSTSQTNIFGAQLTWNIG